MQTLLARRELSTSNDPKRPTDAATPLKLSGQLKTGGYGSCDFILPANTATRTSSVVYTPYVSEPRCTHDGKKLSPTDIQTSSPA